MRLRNIKDAKDIVEKSSYVIKNPFEYKGNYKNLFKNNNPIYIEIGMGKGKFLIENALKYPNINFIGIEKYNSVALRAIQKLEDLSISNLKIMIVDASKIEEIFSHEIDRIYLNFSDPWPKKRHLERRLTSLTFLNKYESIFQNKMTIILKTDNRNLFEFSLLNFNYKKYEFKRISLDLHRDNIEYNIETEYEIKFKEKTPIYLIEVSK